MDAETLDSLVDTYAIDTTGEQYKRLEFIAKLGQHVQLGALSVVELGSATGHLTALLAASCKSVVAVDGSARFLEIARTRVPTKNASFEHCMFESFNPVSKVDLVVMHHVLEHVDDAAKLLRHVLNFLRPGGKVACSVPNAHALSRQLAVEMKLLDSAYALTPNDHKHGHQRVYDWDRLRADVRDAGYIVVAEHGLALKLFADFQNENIIRAGIIGDEQLRGLWPLADRYRDVAGALMMIIEAR
jgi:2-polyprenyl-3-methyl-5-hydroxy-6-metoxy-1,4-benzoquinol methylase